MTEHNTPAEYANHSTRTHIFCWPSKVSLCGIHTDKIHPVYGRAIVLSSEQTRTNGCDCGKCLDALALARSS